MALISATDLRIGMALRHKGDLCKVTKIDHITPGNWRGMVHTKMVNLLKGTQVEFRFRAEDKVDAVRLEQKEMEFLYRDGSDYVFMDNSTYDQLHFSPELVGDGVNFIIANTKCQVFFHEATPISIELPLTVDLKVIETEPRLKGATVSASMKPATVETGAVIQVPQFIEPGEVIKVDTGTGKYLERAK